MRGVVSIDVDTNIGVCSGKLPVTVVAPKALTVAQSAELIIWMVQYTVPYMLRYKMLGSINTI